MADQFTILLDAPDTPTSRIQIAKLGENFEHGKYGKFAITRDDVQTWQRNLALLPGGRAPIDEDHAADRLPRRTEASGWITGITLDGDTPMADVEWTDKGTDAITSKRYLFISPTYGKFRDEHGDVHDNTLIGAALTNRPFLSLPTLTLASDERVSAALDADPAGRFYTRALDGDHGELARALVLLDVDQAERDKAKAEHHSLPDGSYPIGNRDQLHAAAVLAASHHGDWKAARKLIRRRARELGVNISTLPGFTPATADSRALSMKADLLKILGLDGDSDLVAALDDLDLDETQERKILDAATALKQRADTEPRTLEAQAQENGLVLLDADAVRTLQQQAAAGDAAMKQLHEQRFEHAFEKAVEEHKVIPAERDTLHRFFELDADAALQSIEQRQPVMPARPSGEPVIELDLDAPADPADSVARGVHPQSHEVYRRVQAKLKELDKPQSDFTTVLEQMMQDGEL